MLYSVLRRICLGLLRIVYRLRVVGLHNIPAQGSALLAANHTSFLDPVAAGAAVRRPLAFMAKAELFQVPVLGALVRRLNAYPVDRSGADAAALRLALGLLREGRALLVFPEGTRGPEGALRQARAGVGMLVALSDVPVVPVYVRGTGAALPRGAIFPRRSRITVLYGSPLRFAPGRGRTRYQAISDDIMAAIGRLKTDIEGGARPEDAAPTPPDYMDQTAGGPLPAGRIH